MIIVPIQRRAGKSRRLRLLLGEVSIAAIVLGAHSASAQVVASSTHTQVVNAGNATTVTTDNINVASKTAFNRFSDFTVNQPNTVTMILPKNTFNLVNVVSSDVRINGDVISRMQNATGDIGGNLYFITSGGFLVGATGSINTGRLIVRGKDGSGNLLNTDALAVQTAVFSTSGLLDYAAASGATIDGRINAPGGIDIKATTVSLGTGAALNTGAAGIAGVVGYGTGAVVSTAGLVEGVALVKVNGGIAIVGTGSVTVQTGATLDARAATVPAALGGGIDIASSGQITLAGTLTAWDGTAGATAAPVRIAASSKAVIENSFENMTLGNYYLASAARSGVAVSGAITGGTVTITSDADATTASDFDSLKTTLNFLEDYSLGKLLANFGSALDVFYTRSDAQSAISIGATASVRAKADLTVAANSISHAEGKAGVEAKADSGPGLTIALGMAQVASSALVTVDGKLAAGTALVVGANNKATSDLQVQAVSNGEAKALAIAYTDVSTNAAVTVNGTARLDGSSVAVSATNLQGSGAKDIFNNIARTFSKDGSAGGGVAAITNVDLGATLTMAGTIGSITVPGTVTLDSKTVTNGIINAAAASTGSGTLANFQSNMTKFQGSRDGLMQLLLGSAADKLGELVFGKSETETDDDEPDPERRAKRFGAAVTVLFDRQAAVANVTGNITSIGQAQVNSLVRDTTVRNNAKAAVAAETQTDGAATSIAGAAAWSTADYTSTATLGGVIVAGGVAVNAVTDRPRGGNYDLDFSSEEGGVKNDVLAVYGSLNDKITPTLGVEKGFFASSAGATAKTDSAKNAAVSGTVSYTGITADTRAWVDPLAALTLSGALSVKADATITVMNLAGALPVTSLGFATSGGDAAGISVGYTGITANTLAGIGRGVTVDRQAGTGAVSVDVDAKSAINAITLAPQAGKASGKTGSGTFATNAIDGVTRATISKDARIDLGIGTLGIDALTTLEIWAVGGSIAMTKADGTGDTSTVGSVGVAGALNDVEFDTLARVGDASSDDAGTATTAAAAVNAGITAEDVAITATSTGSINALSVAGVSTSTTPAAPAPGADGATDTDAKPKGTLDRAKGKLLYVAGLIKAPMASAGQTYASYAESYASGVEKAEQAKAQDAMSKGTTPTRGFGIAGSASVNLSDLSTRVETTGAVFRKATDATAANASFITRAVEGVDMLSVTGGAAITSGTAKLPEGNTLISGAYGLSYSTNETAAALTGTTITGFGNVAVEAAANGSRIAAGLALSADTTKTAEGTTFAASVSHLVARDGASAIVTGGSITGGNAGSLSILAYDGLTMGAGAGGLSWSSNNAAGGAATVIDVQSPGGGAANARLVGTPVANFANLGVRGLTAARIAGVAAAGAVNTSGDSTKTALTVGLSINTIDMDSTALIDTGATGTGTISVSGAVNVFAGDMAQGQTEAIASSGKTGGTAGSGMLGNFNLGANDFSGDDPLRASDFKGGTQILSIAVPISASRGKALGLGFASNTIDNDRTASIIGGSGNGSTPTITAGSVSIQAVEHSDIMALGVGIGGSTEGMGLMGSISRNLIEGSSSAGLGRSTAAANNLVVKITGAPVATPNISIGASGDGGVFALAGAVAIGKSSAGGIAVGVNDIIRTTAAGTGGVDMAASNAGLHATIDGVSFKGTPDIDLLANSRGRIIGNAVAVAGSAQGASVAGAATANSLAPTIAATASRVNYLDASSGDLKIRAQDSSSILSTALVIGISGAKGALAAGVSVNRIDADVSASLKVAAGDNISVRNVVLETISTAQTTGYGLGVGGGSKFGGAGSIGINLTDSDTSSLLTFNGGAVNATGSIGVIARRDATIDIGAGALAFGAQGAAIGAAVIVNDFGGSTTANIVGVAGNTGAIRAFTGSGDEAGRSLTGLRTGGLTESLQQFDALAGFGSIGLGNMIKSETATFKGVAVNASSTAAVRTIAVTGAISGQGVAVGVTGVVNNVTGSTDAAITAANIAVGAGSVTQAGVALDVRASSQQVGMTFAGAIAGSGGGTAAAPVISDGYAGTTTALIEGGSLSSTGSIVVKAVANQSSTALAAAGAVSGAVAASVAGVSPRFQSLTTATLNAPTAIVARGGGGVAVNADSTARALATFGTLAISGNGAGAGAIVVATNENKTSATYNGLLGSDGLGAVRVEADTVSVLANGTFDVMVAGASIAGSAGVALVGNGVGVVHRGEVTATADALRYNRTGGTINVRAVENVSIVPVVGQVGLGISPTGAGASLGVIAVLAQSKVDATLSRPLINASAVTVQATGYNQIDAVQLGVAIGGVGIGANVTYLGIGKVTDTGALTASSGETSDGKVAAAAGSDGSDNANMNQLGAGGSVSGAQIAAQTSSITSVGEQNAAAGSTAGRAAFTSIAAPDGAAESRVRAQITGNSGSGVAALSATTVVIDSDANLRSKSTNAQLTGGVAAGSATVGITRNAAQSIAYLGNVTASGKTLTINATTGEARAANAPTTVNNPTKAAEAEIYSGTVGVGTLAVGVADVKLQSAALARSEGRIGFTNATIQADDLTTARSHAVGVVAGGAAINITIAQSVKDGIVSAQASNVSTSTNLSVLANALGGASAESYAGSGGVMFAGNAAVATAIDKRTVSAIIGEGSAITGTSLTLTARSTPLVTAKSYGVAVSGGIAAGASVANASASGSVSALIGEAGTIACTINCMGGGILVQALVDKPGSGDNVTSSAKGSAGGYLDAINGASAISGADITTTAAIGVDLDGIGNAALVLPATILRVIARRALAQYSESTGVTAAGLLAVGAQRAESSSDGTTRAALENVDGSGRGVALATVSSDVLDENKARVQAGAGGLGAGLAAMAYTNSNGSALTEITPANGKTFKAGVLTATATAGADYKATSDSMLASAIGASGTTSDNRVNTNATVNIGRAIANAAPLAGSRLEALEFNIIATNIVGEVSNDGGSAAGAGGGIATGAAALVKNVLNQSATVNLFDGLTMRQYDGDATQNTRATYIDAQVLTSRNHGVTLDVGGAMQLPFAQVDSTYNANTSVIVGKNILLRGDQGIGIGTNVQQSTVDTAAAQIYGLAGLGGSKATATGNTAGLISVGDDTMIESMMDIRVSTGTSSDGVLSDNYGITTQADTFNWTALPLDTEAEALSTVNADNRLVLGAATIRSARDLILQGEAGTASPRASGAGHNPYLELFSLTNSSGDTATDIKGSIQIDGTTLVAGYLNNRTITIDSNRGGTSTRDGVAIAGSTGFAVTTNDGTGADRLGQFIVSGGTFNTLDYVNQQITDLKAQITTRGLAIPADPATAADGSQARQDLRDALNLAASKSELLATLAGLYETRLALAGSTARNAVVVGGTIVPSTGADGVTRYGVSSNGGVFAAGGRVTLTTDSFVGGRAANVTANSGGVVTIVNNTGFDTIVGNTFVPFKVNGAITYDGKAQALLANVTPHLPTGSNTDGVVSVSSGTASTRSDVIVLGTVQNVSGAFKAVTPAGNYVQFGEVNVASFSAEAPTGLFSVSNPTGTFSQGLPLSFFYGAVGMSLFDVTVNGQLRGATMGAITASEYLASYIGAKRVGVDGLSGGLASINTGFVKTFGGGVPGDVMYELFLRTSTDNVNYGSNFVSRANYNGGPGTIIGNGPNLWGGGFTAWLPCTATCEYLSEDSDLGNNVTNTVGLFVWDGDSGSAYRNDHIYQVVPTFRDGVIVTNLSAAQMPATYPAAATEFKPSITAQQVMITAKYIDVSGTITAGPIKQRSLTVNDIVTDTSRPIFETTAFGGQDFVGFETTSFGKAMASVGTSIDLLKGNGVFGGLTASGNNIGAQFIATGGLNADGTAKGYIKVDDVAAAGGGSITLTGKILNTNPLGGGKLRVLNGFGNINIENKTGYEIQVGTLNAGLSAEGRITLRDGATTTEFTNSVGGQVTKSVIQNGIVQTPVTYSGNAGLSDANPLYYQPTGDIYYSWTDTRSIKRVLGNQGASPWLLTVSPWAWDESRNNQAPQVGYFIDLATDFDTAANTIRRALAGRSAEYVQVFSGQVTNNYHNYLSPGQDGRLRVNFDVPLAADLSIVTGAKATYPIALVFDQGGTGGINVLSNNGGNIKLTGALTFGGGTVALQAAKSGVNNTADGLVVSRNLEITARDSIGTLADTANHILESPFRANVMGGYVLATSSAGNINLQLNSVASTNGVAAPTYLNKAWAPTGSVKIDSNSSLIGQSGLVNIVSGKDVILSARGTITGATYLGASNLSSRGLTIDLPDSGALTAIAGGDIAIEQASVSGAMGVDRKLQIAEITTNGNVLLKAPGSIVAADATATVDQEKLARFLAAAKALQLAPGCGTNCGTQDAASLGTLDQTIRADGLAAYTRLQSTVPGEAGAAEGMLTALFGFVPASAGAIATLTITRDAKIQYQLRSQGRDAYDRYALFNPAMTAESSRGLAVAQGVDAIGKVSAFGAIGGIALSPDKKTVTVTDASAAALSQGGTLYQIALSTLTSKGVSLVGTAPTTAELQQGLQFYLDGLRAPVAALLPNGLPDLKGLSDAAQILAVSNQIDTAALTNWVSAQSVVAQRNRAATDAVGKVVDIQAFGANAGLSLSANATVVTVTDWNQPALQAGGALYQLGLATLRSQVGENGLRDTIPLPTNADVQRGLQVYLDSLRAPIADLLPGALPTLAGTDTLAQRATISAAISNAGLVTWASKQQIAATAELTSLFGAVPVSKDSIATLKLNNLEARTTGSVWAQSMLDVAFPSTAFVPVADTQFETRKPVINAQGVTMIAGNSIGSFDASKTFSYDASGLVSGLTGPARELEKNLAAAYLASAGPGDLAVTPVRDGTGKVVSVSFATRRDQPLQLNANGIVNAIAATNYTTFAPTMNSASSNVLGDIFINNSSTLTLGSIISEKWRVGSSSVGCALGDTAAANCESRIRIVAPNIVGTTSGAAGLSYTLNGITRRLDSGDGSAIVMGGLVRLEASTGSIVAADYGQSVQKNHGAILVDATQLEVLRAAGDIALVRRANAAIGYQTGSIFGSYAASNDLVVGDVFAGGRLQLDNPYGSFLVGRVESPLESERRNARIVVGTLAIRAAGDIGSADVGSTGIPGQFDIQTPVIQQFVAGYDYATGLPGAGPAPAGLGTGSGFFALRGVSQIGGLPGSLLGARGDITIGTLNNSIGVAQEIRSSVKFLSDVVVGGLLNLTTDGDVNFPDPDVRITGLGVVQNSDVVDLSRLALNLKGKFDYFNTRSIILGSLTAGGGTIESSLGSVSVTGTIYGNGGPETPFTMKGRTGVTIGSTGLGSVSLLATNGDVRITGQARATDLTLNGNNVYVAGGLYGRSVSVTAAPTGTIAIGGSVLLQRDTIRPQELSRFTMIGGNLTLADMVSAQDSVTIEGQSITGAARAMFLNTGTLSLSASGALRLDPTTMLVNVGSAYLSSGDLAHGGSAVTLSSFSGGSLSIFAPVGIALGTTTATGSIGLSTAGALALNGSMTAGGAFSGTARSIAFAPIASIRDSASLNLIASETIAGGTNTILRSRGAVTIAARDSLTIGQVKANGGSINITNGGLTVASTFVSDGASYDIHTGAAALFSGALTSAGNFNIDAGTNLTLNGAVAMTGANGAATLGLDAGSNLIMGRNARITAKASTAAVRMNAGTVSMDALASITGAAVSVVSRGLATLGDIKASEVYSQAISLRAAGALSAGLITGGTTTVASTAGSVTLRNTVKSGMLTVMARDDIATNGITATQATINSTLGNVALNGGTRVIRPDSPTTARLTVTASKAITVAGATSAAGGMMLTGSSLATIDGGYLSDADMPGALTALRADTVNVTFNTGSQTAPIAMRIDARGRTTSNINDAAFRFVTVRPINFDVLYANRGMIDTSTALNVTGLTMRDYLVLNTPTGSVALQGQVGAPWATRTAVTGALNLAKLVVTPGGGAPAVTVNGIAK